MQEDITLLIDYFLKEFSASHGKVVTSISPAARKALTTHPWPGNVRELKNTIESMVVVDYDGVLDVDDLTEDLAPNPPGALEAGTSGAQPSSKSRPLARRDRGSITSPKPSS